MSGGFDGRPARRATWPGGLRLPRLAGAASLLASGFVWGLALDARRSVSQPALFAAISAASLLGATLACVWLRPRGAGARVALVLLAIVSWRLAYFPVMVFSGHLASIGEWLLAAAGVRPIVWPVFLVAVSALHAAAVVLASWLVWPPRRWLRALPVPVFVLASLVSISTRADLRPLPDRAWSVARAVPVPTAPERNPYLRRLAAPGYSPAQRVLLLAAGLTYDTIPGSPWARVVKGVLEADFDANPYASTHDRVVEHYLAYRSAQPFIGCRDPGACPLRSRSDAPGR